jgi:T-complex protein 11.
VFISPLFTFYCNSCNCKFAWIGTRVREFIQQSITSPTAAPLRIPPGLSSLQTELTAITGQFLRLVSHNRAVFGEYYTDIIVKGVSAAAVTEWTVSSSEKCGNRKSQFMCIVRHWSVCDCLRLQDMIKTCWMLLKEKLCNLNKSHNIVRIMKYKRQWWARHVYRMEDSESIQKCCSFLMTVVSSAL